MKKKLTEWVIPRNHPEPKHPADDLPVRHASGSAPNGNKSINAFTDPEYQKSKQKWLDLIPKSSLYASIDRYIGGIALGLFSLAFGAVVNAGGAGAAIALLTTNPVIIGLVIAGFAASALGAFAHYQNVKLTTPAHMTHNEHGDIARAKMYGQSIATALENGKTRDVTIQASQSESATPIPPMNEAPQQDNQKWVKTISQPPSPTNVIVKQ